MPLLPILLAFLGAHRATARVERVLVIGGTQFIGRATVEAILDTYRSASVTLLNRGRSANPFEGHPRVAVVKCDRYTGCFSSYLRNARERVAGFDAVVDFIAFEPAHVQPLFAVDPEFLGHYVFVSTDSVYMASDPTHYSRDADGRLLEESATRPSNAEEAERLHARDTYGSMKLYTEGALMEQSRQNGLHFTALRLPDVFGPWENTGRQLDLLGKLARGDKVGLLMPGLAHPDAPIGLAYAPDVAAAIIQVIREGRGVYGQVINLSSEEAPTWKDFVRIVHDEYAKNVPEIPSLAFDARDGTDFVSVSFGAISNNKAERLLPNWRRTPLRDAVRTTVRWVAETFKTEGKDDL